VVGGTGFYLRALAEPLFEEPPLDPARRGRLLDQLDVLDTAELRRWCRRLDPDRAELGRTQLLRAVEIALLTGVPISRWHRAAPRPPRARARYLVVDPGSALPSAIEQRVDAMLAAGWAEEVDRLRQVVPPGAPAWKASGYGAIREWVEGGLTKDEARRRVIIETRQYAKRQRTWFRHQLPEDAVTHLDPRAPEALEAAGRWWQREDDA
jgi:tRNA dimethylallyltransferase